MFFYPITIIGTFNRNDYRDMTNWYRNNTNIEINVIYEDIRLDSVKCRIKCRNENIYNYLINYWFHHMPLYHLHLHFAIYAMPDIIREHIRVIRMD